MQPFWYEGLRFSGHKQPFMWRAAVSHLTATLQKWRDAIFCLAKKQQPFTFEGLWWRVIRSPSLTKNASTSLDYARNTNFPRSHSYSVTHLLPFTLTHQSSNSTSDHASPIFSSQLTTMHHHRKCTTTKNAAPVFSPLFFSKLHFSCMLFVCFLFSTDDHPPPLRYNATSSPPLTAIPLFFIFF